MPETKGAVNAYICPRGHQIVTRNVDEGVTPMFLRCRHERCQQTALSQGYRVDQTLAADYEWYAPKSAERKRLDRETREHCALGGLLLRKVQAAAAVSG